MAIYVDLDGTLAYYDNWKGVDHIGEPIPDMLFRVRRWLAEEKTVKIFTARANTPECIPPIQEWLKKHDLPALEVTATKGFDAVEIWDDRAVQVEPNTGLPVDLRRRYR